MPQQVARETFVGEALAPVAGTFDVRSMARGAPGVPQQFSWRGADYRVAEIVETWKTTGSCRHGSGEQYVRRHWFRVRVAPAAVMTLYCDRTARKGSKSRWWLYSWRSGEP